MKNILLYITTVLIWGSTWFAIEFQLGQVAVEISLVYRFALAGLFILTISKIRGLPLKFTILQHGYIALLGLFNFSLNYFFLYLAQNYMSSAMASISFSMLLLVNIINNRLFFGKKIAAKTYLGAAFGLLGISVLFWPEISQHRQTGISFAGLGLVFVGVIFASLGNMVSVRNSNHHLPVFQSSGWGMLYGTLFLLLIAIYKGTEFSISFESSYLISLAYLVFFGTIIAFYSYFYLLKSIGPEKASYSIVLFPAIAVILSSIFEGFNWTGYTITGFVLVALGNLIMLLPIDKIRKKYFVSNFAKSKLRQPAMSQKKMLGDSI